jgi:hypothetical protein
MFLNHSVLLKLNNRSLHLKRKAVKKISLLILILSSIYLQTSAQNVPDGMSYQAVARDKTGKIISSNTIAIKISLRDDAEAVTYYSEIHQVVTNESGLFSLVIGRGLVVSGNFLAVPWSTKNIWMDLATKSVLSADFETVYSTEMMAVPYAFHAGKASMITGGAVPYYLPGGNVMNGPVPAVSWQITGNSGTNPPTEYLGTSDLKDLYFKTNAQERARILSTGNMSITTNLTVGIDLTVQRDATINRDLRVKDDMVIDSNLSVKRNAMFNTVGGSTMVYGPFTVDKQSPSVLTGTLRVDQITNLNDSLTVTTNKPTILTGTLRVNGTTNLYNNFNVNSQSPSVMTGTLRVDSNVTFNNHLILDNPNWNSLDSATGALVVAGGAGIGKNLNVGGDLRVSGNTEFAGQVKITDARPSENPDSGALVVSGGVGIGKQLNVGGYSHFYDSIRIDSAVRLMSTLSVYDSVLLNNKMTVNNIATLNGRVVANGQMIIEDQALANSDQSDYENYPLQVDAGKQGIAVKVAGSTDASNNYMAFFDNSGMQGRIEGVSVGQYQNTAEYQAAIRALNARVLSMEFTVSGLAISEAAALVNLGAALISTTPCVGLGVCATVPIPSMIASAALSATAMTVALAASSYVLNDLYNERSNYQNAANNVSGVTYESGAGDYAEYLELADHSEKIHPGDIVGLKGNKISRNTANADKIMVVSTRPIVSGNMPADKTFFRQVAFLGQVPVKVMGKVNPGDYILPDGNNFGIGRAVAPSELKNEDIKNVAGVAWSASGISSPISTINVAVGLVPVTNQNEVEALQNELKLLSQELTESDLQLQKLLPGYMDENLTASTQPVATPVFTPLRQDQIFYHPLSRQVISDVYQSAIASLEVTQPSVFEILKTEKLINDPAFRQNVIDRVYTKVQESQKEMKDQNSILR